MLLHDYLEYFAREIPRHPLVEMGDATLSYRETDEQANRFANSLLSNGLVKGDRFAYISKNSIDMVIMYYGASKVGVIPVPLNYCLAPRESLYIINDSGSKMVFCQPEFIAGIESVRNELDSVSAFIVVDGDAEIVGWASLESWRVEDANNPRAKVSESEQLYQMYTSGTTGLPKGAMLSQHSVCSNVEMVTLFAKMAVSNDRNLIVAPIYHAAAGMTMMSVVSNGNTLVLFPEFDARTVVESLEKDRITMVTLVPAMIQACLIDVPDLGERDFPQLRRITYGASPIALETLQNAMQKFRCDFAQGFGMTEISCLGAGMGPEIHRRALAGEPGLLLSAGRAVLGTEIRIADENDIEVPRGTVGEIQVRGPHVMMGYWNKPEASEKALRGGWMHSGDAACMDDEGFIYIQDRIKDMIVSGAENIYPAEIESALFQHSAVADAAVIGIPSDKWGESVLAFLVLKEGESLGVDEVVEFCRSRLAGYKIPRRVEFIEEIPRNASGKVLKRDLREPYWKGHERRVV